MPNKKIESYTAAGIFPTKVILNKYCISDSGKIRPIHIQINPTNACNLNCHFCSCGKRDKSKKIAFPLMKKIIYQAYTCGCRAVTITGGGEPCLYLRINGLIDYIYDLGIKVGLVSNGIALDKIDTHSKITWLRISHSDYRTFGKDYTNDLEKNISLGQNIDWAFSYVISEKPNFPTIARVIDFANAHNFTHVRLVSDLLNLDNVMGMETIREKLKGMGVDDKIVIYQGRKMPVRGRKKCLISLLKPVVGVDGLLYPCCGFQYSKDPPANDYDETMCMGEGLRLPRMYQDQQYFDGSKCTRCYYDEYNILLDKLIEPIDHLEFA